MASAAAAAAAAVPAPPAHDRDRLVGQLELPPPPPPTPAALRRRDSASSLSSAGSSAAAPVPRSSSFTRSRRFLTGHLSAREAVGLVDHPAAPDHDAHARSVAFDRARAALHAAIALPANHPEPPPPPSPPPSTTTTLSTTLSTPPHPDEAQPPTPTSTSAPPTPPPPPPPPHPVAAPATPSHPPTPIAAVPSSSASSSPSAPHTPPPSPPPPSPPPPCAAPEFHALPRPTTISRLRAIFSTRAAHSPSSPPPPPQQQQQQQKQEEEEGPSPSRSDAENASPSPSSVPRTAPPTVAAADKPEPTAVATTAAAAAPRPFSDALRERLQNLPEKASPASRKDHAKRRMDLFKRFKLIQDNLKFDLSSSSPLPEQPQPTAAKLTRAVDRLLPADSHDDTTLPSHPRRRVDNSHPVNDDSVSLTSATEEFASASEFLPFPNSSSSSAPLPPASNSRECSDESVKNKEQEKKSSSSPVEERKEDSTTAASKSSFLSHDPSPLSLPVVESVTSSSSTSKGDRYCAHPGDFGVPLDAYNTNNAVPAVCTGVVLTETSRPMSQYAIPLPLPRLRAAKGVSVHSFMEGPVSKPVAEEGNTGRLTRRDSHAAYLDPLADETRLREAGAAATSDLFEGSERDLARKLKQELPGEQKKTEGDGKKAMSVFQKRLTQAKDAGAIIVAHAKKLPRGASFPRLRSSGEPGTSEQKSVERSKSVSGRSGKKVETQPVAKNKTTTATTSKASQDVAAVPVGKLQRRDGNGKEQVGLEAKGVPRSQKRIEAKTHAAEQLDVIKKAATESSLAKKAGTAVIETCAPAHNISKVEQSVSVKKVTASVSEQQHNAVKKAGASASQQRLAVKKTATSTGEAKIMPIVPVVATKAATAEAVSNAKTSCEGEAATVGRDVDHERRLPEHVTVQRVIRRVKRDGSVEVVTKKIRLRPESILPNGDVVVRRAMKVMKEDGKGYETLSVLQVIPRKRTPKASGSGDATDTESSSAASMPDLSVATAKVADEPKAVFDDRAPRPSERAISLPSVRESDAKPVAAVGRRARVKRTKSGVAKGMGGGAGAKARNNQPTEHQRRTHVALWPPLARVLSFQGRADGDGRPGRFAVWRKAD